ncbi:hypothetical protein [Mesorhizobium sp. M2A.F.Ca.ET.043.02.1.1]|uniref:hypothetical protein n=1 Tax=Mesorhizobium sp. M2A.F.Ca.ET.043.02.1.1 TaxID=2493670 RepID=UPI000F757E21|nr:hypothetical protein [Mesorhizobium sp. M2A.F.Ca.ET.043.02.1.1]AZO04338.1 hypothetical protein EJ068_15625 [Mesorhizobium sp. M2A.F.Ca.ET.043.02.1.1]
MTNAASSNPLSAADSVTLTEILRQAELHLQAQLSAAIAADQRAYTFAGLNVATSVLLMGGSYSLATQQHDPNLFIGAVAFFVAVGLFVAAWVAVMSARSVDFEFAGSQPGVWSQDLADRKPLQVSLAEQCQNYDDAIAANRATMANNSWMFNAAVNVALGSVGLGAISYLYWVGHVVAAQV